MLMEKKHIWEITDVQEQAAIMDYAVGYRTFLDYGKTEERCVKKAVQMAEEQGFHEFREGEPLQAGDRIYWNNRGKSLMLAVVGSDDITQGMHIVAAHIDSPRLDLKPVPLFEDEQLAFLKTHYYGGIKKYQWTCIPLSLYGTVVTKNGTVEVELGTDEDDLALVVTDLLPHLADEQMQKKMHLAIEGEKLNVLIGNIPAAEGDKKVTEAIMKLFREKYGIEEEDFVSSDLEVVPQFDSKDVGLDRSMVGGYGHDDRVCAYTALTALFAVKHPQKTAVCLLADREEVGSMGNTGMRSHFFEDKTAELIASCKGDYNDLYLRRCFGNSACLSADVAAAYDPQYNNAYERRNTPFVNRGITLVKYTGARGKSGSSEASAAFTGYVRNLFNENGVVWQIGELGKVDGGGGGTVAQYLANLNIDVIDCGVALLSMHAPFEIAGKGDIYMGFKGYRAFFGA